MWRRLLRVACLFGVFGWSSGCAILEESLSPRTYSVNEGADAVLNNAILLNILRASDSEPLNFVAIAKYTAAGQLGANAQAGQFTYAAAVTHPGSQYGPNTLSGQLNNSFDLNVLETKDFYTGLLRGMDATQTSLWFSEGLSRELVFYVLVGAIRTTRLDGAVYEYRNDPADDDWHAAETGSVEHHSPMCIPRTDGPTRAAQFDRIGIWYGTHADDCRFQKFRYLVDLAVKYGLRIEPVTMPNPKWTKDSTTEPKTLSTPVTCYDPALFREYAHRATIPGVKVCGGSKSVEAHYFSIRGPGTLKGIELVVRSPFAIPVSRAHPRHRHPGRGGSRGPRGPDRPRREPAGPHRGFGLGSWMFRRGVTPWCQLLRADGGLGQHQADFHAAACRAGHQHYRDRSQRHADDPRHSLKSDRHFQKRHTSKKGPAR